MRIPALVEAIYFDPGHNLKCPPANFVDGSSATAFRDRLFRPASDGVVS
jgi:hypothetical protein